MSVTQKQIAEHLGVSQSLVTQALRGVPGISDESRRRVEEAARMLGYGSHSNIAARSMRAQRGGGRARTHTLALLMGELFDGRPTQEIPFYQPILQGFKLEADAREMDLSVFSPTLERMPRLLTNGGVDGIICLYNDPLDGPFRDFPFPCPILRVGDGEPQEWVLRPDDKLGIRLATQHLIERGHTRIAYLGDFNPGITADLMYKDRLDGYLSALADAGIKVRNELIESHIGGPEPHKGAAGVQRLLERTRDFSALVCFNDTSAVGAMEELERQGMSVPRDVSVTGFDDTWTPEYPGPALTTVFFDRLAMGKRAIDLICNLADEVDLGGNRQPKGHELWPVQLVERQSTRAL